MDIINIPLAYILKFAYQLIPNYAIALLLFAILVKIVLFPLSIKQQKNLVKQAALQPKINAIRKRYQGRNDQATQQKMQQETMDLYQKEGYNPMGGCLPMLLQLPIIFALFNVINNPLKYLIGLSNETISELQTKLEIVGKSGLDVFNAVKNATIDLGLTVEQMDAIKDLNFSLFSVDLSQTPTVAFNSLAAIVLFMIPILSGVFSYLSMKISRKLMPQPQMDGQPDMGCSMKMMDLMMPLMSLWIAFSVPAVIGVYWIYQNNLGTVQQFILKKMYPVPTFTEEELKAIEKEMNGKAKKTSSSTRTGKSGQPIRSLHHIDDEDFADTAKNAKKQENSPEQNHAKDKKKSGNTITLIVLDEMGKGRLHKVNWQEVPNYLG